MTQHQQRLWPLSTGAKLNTKEGIIVIIIVLFYVQMLTHRANQQGGKHMQPTAMSSYLKGSNIHYTALQQSSLPLP